MERLHFVSAGIIGGEPPLLQRRDYWVEPPLRQRRDYWGSLHFVSAIKERVLVLRGNRIAVIESLGAIEDQFVTIVSSDNEIAKLEKFSYINRLGTLLINIKRITYISPNLGDELTDNLITSLVDIEPFAYLPELQFLSLLDNAVTKRPNYRLSVIQKLQHLSLLDFEKVKQRERAEAAQKFHSKEATKKVAAKARTPAVVDAQGTTKEQGPKVVALTPAQSTPIKAFSTGQVRAEFAIPRPDFNMTEVSEEAEVEKMETYGQDPEDGVEQKQRDHTPIQEEKTGAARKFHSKETEEEEKVTSKACAPVQVMDVQYTRREQGSRVVATRSEHFTTVEVAIGNMPTLLLNKKPQLQFFTRVIHLGYKFRLNEFSCVVYYT